MTEDQRPFLNPQQIREKIEQIMERFSALYDGDFAGHRVEVYGMICEQLCMIDGGKASWQWRYLSQVRSGKLDPSRRFARAIEIYYVRLVKKELLVPVPACPICGLAHTHSHDERVYDPAVQELKPVSKPRKPRPARISIRKDNMAKAAQTIINNLDANKVCELVAILKEA